MKKLERSTTNFNDANVVEQYTVYPLIHKVVSKPQLIKFIGAVANQRVLDFGCGTGHITFELSRRGAICVGVDPSRRFIEAAQTFYPNLDFRLIRRSRLEGFRQRSFDKVIMSLVLPNVETKQEFKMLFREASRVLKPQGELIFSTLHPLMVRNLKDSFREVMIPTKMNYFSTGAKFRNTALLTDNTFITFTNTHWNLEDISSELAANDLVIVAIKEPKMSNNRSWSVLENSLHTPYVICFKARKIAKSANRRG